MRAFEILLNGEKLCRAGVANDGVVSAIVNSLPRHGSEECHITVGGINSRDQEYLKWVRHKTLSVGDRLQIEVIEAAEVDEPEHVGEVERLRSKEEYVRDLVKEMGWTVQERPEKSA
jgi:hypothetical protein